MSVYNGLTEIGSNDFDTKLVICVKIYFMVPIWSKRCKLRTQRFYQFLEVQVSNFKDNN